MHVRVSEVVREKAGCQECTYMKSVNINSGGGETMCYSPTLLLGGPIDDPHRHSNRTYTA